MHRIVTIVVLLSSSSSAAKVPTVPKDHPRLYLRPADLPQIKEKIRRAELPTSDPQHSAVFANDWKLIKSHSWTVINAFLYLVKGDQAKGLSAINSALGTLKSAKTGDNSTGRDAMEKGAIVYDWCYNHPQMTAQKQKELRAELLRLAKGVFPGYPVKSDANAVAGHTQGWTARAHLPTGVAIYDEDKVLYDSGAKFFFARYLPVRDFFYPAQLHHQGNMYGTWHLDSDIHLAMLFRALGAGNVFKPDQRYIPYDFIYTRRPDGKMIPRGGDSNTSGTRYWVSVLLAGAYYNDPYLLHMADGKYFTKGSRTYNVFNMILRPLKAKTRPITELPLTRYFPGPMGEMVARTAWDLDDPKSRAAIITMRIGETFFGNHQFKDFGVFQIYYRGPLAISSGSYNGINKDGTAKSYGSEHWKNYYHQTISKNGLLILDPAEKQKIYGTTVANDGGQIWPNGGKDHPISLDVLTSPQNGYKMGRVTAHQLGPDAKTPEYSYLAGDITAAYAKSKAQLVTRSMVALNTGNATYPAALVVLDRVEAKQASFRKSWLLHSIQEPVVQGQTVSIKRDTSGHGGRLVSETLLPQAATIKKVGGAGKEWWIESTQTNYKATGDEIGAWRVEVSPSKPALADRFLHVLTVMDATTAKGPAVQRIESGELLGASVLDRVVLFSRSGKPMEGGTFTLKGLSGTLKILLCDLKPGAWTVREDGAVIASAVASKDGQCIYFSGGTGSYALKPGLAPDGGAGSGDTGGSDLEGDADGSPAVNGGEPSDGCSCDLTRRRCGWSWPAGLGLVLVVLVVVRRGSSEAPSRGDRHEKHGCPLDSTQLHRAVGACRASVAGPHPRHQAVQED